MGGAFGPSRFTIPNGTAVGEACGWSVVGITPYPALSIRQLRNSSCAILPFCIPSIQHYLGCAHLHIITLAAQKGGVGKTTLAVNLAVAAEAAGIKTALFDLDPQESATAWSERRTAESPHVEPISARRLDQAIDAAEASGFGLTIIDTPPAAGAEAAAAAQRADLVVIPCRPSLIDLDAIKRTAQLITSTGRTGVVVLNAAPPTATTLLDDARTLAEATGLRVARAVLRERSAYRAAWPYGLGVIEHEPKGKAALEIAALQKHIFDDLMNCTPANVKA